MKIEQTNLKDCVIIHDTVFTDERGYFFESFNKNRFEDLSGISVNFVQDNQSKSCQGILRGLHFQTGAFAQAKLVRVLKGTVVDVAVDLRIQSSTFGKHIAIELSEENHLQLFIPRGFAHGFVVLSHEATFFYKCDNYYHKSYEGGIIYNDVDLNIDWKIETKLIQLSEKDKLLPTFQTIKDTLNFYL